MQWADVEPFIKDLVPAAVGLRNRPQPQYQFLDTYQAEMEEATLKRIMPHRYMALCL
jgi:hypothetical protein